MKHFINTAGHVSDRLCVAALEAGLVSQVNGVLKEIEAAESLRIAAAKALKQHYVGYFQFQNMHKHPNDMMLKAALIDTITHYLAHE